MYETFTGYIPRVGDRVRVLRTAKEGGHKCGPPSVFGGRIGSVAEVDPALISCRVVLDGGGGPFTDYSGRPVPGPKFFPGELEPYTQPAPYLCDCDPGDEAHFTSPTAIPAYNQTERDTGRRVYAACNDAGRRFITSPLSLTDYPDGMPEQPEPVGYRSEGVDDVAAFVAQYEQESSPAYHLGYADGYRDAQAGVA